MTLANRLVLDEIVALIRLLKVARSKDKILQSRAFWEFLHGSGSAIDPLPLDPPSFYRDDQEALAADWSAVLGDLGETWAGLLTDVGEPRVHERDTPGDPEEATAPPATDQHAALFTAISRRPQY